jgi:DNA polymerase III alpha subunit (gram-positive type)
MVKEIIFDFETTGLDYTKDAIIQYTFLDYQTDEYISGYVNPQRPMTKKASEITGVTDIDLKEYQPFSHHVEKILNFIGNEKYTYLVAHNGDRFDKLFFSAALQSCGKSLSPFWKFIDTLKLYRHFSPEYTQYTMDFLREKMNLTTKNNHSATKDVFDLSLLYHHLRKNYHVKNLHDTSFHYINFGKYKGGDFRNIPKDYLDFLIQQKIYLTNPDVFCYLQQYFPKTIV